MREVLIIRFGALGDLCVLTWALAHLKDNALDPSVRVTLVTKAQFAPLMAEVRGVDEVVGLSDSRLKSLSKLARTLNCRRWDVVIDAHNTLRSNLLLGFMGRRAAHKLAKDTFARLAFMSWGRADKKLTRTMRERFFELIQLHVGPDDGSLMPPLISLKSSSARSNTLGLAPGAQWDSKRWPEKHYAQLVRDLNAHQEYEIRVFLGPRENDWYQGSELQSTIADHPQVAVVQLPNLIEVARHLATCKLVVTNDSGILHLAEAVGTPVLAFYGPTVREFGYFPQLASSRVMEIDLSCRPCSRNGKRVCHRGDHACLERIAPDTVLPVLLAMSHEGSRP